MAAPVRITVPTPIATGKGLKAGIANLPQIQAAQAAVARQQAVTRQREARGPEGIEDAEERRRRRRALTRAATVLTGLGTGGGTGQATVLGG